MTDAGQNRREAVRDGYESLAGAYDAERDPGSVERRAVETLSTRLAGSVEGPIRLLDAGCGAGEPVLRAIADGSVVAAERIEPVGVDFAREQVRRAAVHAPVLRGDMSALPIREGVVDAVTAFHSIIHVPIESHPAVYREFARVLRPGGRLLVSVGRHAWSGSNPDWLDGGAAMHWSFPGLETSREYLADAGFEVCERWKIGDEMGEEEWVVLLCRRGDR